MFQRVLFILLIFFELVHCFHWPAMIRMNTLRRFVRSDQGSDPLEALRQRIRTDPTYNVFDDPQGYQLMLQSAPENLLALKTELDRLEAIFQEAKTGDSPITDVDAALENFDFSRDGLPSDPQSDWFKAGMPNEWDGRDVVKECDDAINELRQQYPNVPFE